MKIRVELKPEQIEMFVEDISKIYEIISVSKPYANRNSILVRVYMEVETKGGIR